MLASTTEIIFHKKVINMLTPGDKGPLEKCRNAFFFVILMKTGEKYRSSKNTLYRSLPAIFSLLSTRYVIRSGDADLKFVIFRLGRSGGYRAPP